MCSGVSLPDPHNDEEFGRRLEETQIDAIEFGAQLEEAPSVQDGFGAGSGALLLPPPSDGGPSFTH